jgi:hypothetical protein
MTKKFLCALWLVVFFYNAPMFAASLISRGVAVGIPFGALSKPGFSFDNTSFYFSEPKVN